MSNIRPHNYRNTIHKWLFAVVLLLGFVALSGTPLQINSDQPSLKTTLVVSRTNNSGKIISYARALRPHSSLSLFSIASVDLSLLHTRQIATELSMLPVYFTARSQTGYFYHLKSFPQNAGDDLAVRLG